MREKHILQDRVAMVGAVKHDNMRQHLIQGHIFLNTSLTEAFCIAIVEAASCGLKVVSTNVGGIPEVLPDDLIVLCEAKASSLVAGIDRAIQDVRSAGYDPNASHAAIRRMYSWKDVAERTEIVYRKVIHQQPLEPHERLVK